MVGGRENFGADRAEVFGKGLTFHVGRRRHNGLSEGFEERLAIAIAGDADGCGAVGGEDIAR